jgi:RHS repeat-associated protein
MWCRADERVEGGHMGKRAGLLTAGACLGALSATLPAITPARATSTLTLSMPTATATSALGGTYSTTITGTTSCAATAMTGDGASGFLAQIAPDCLDRLLVKGGGYGTLDEQVLLNNLSLTVDGDPRSVALGPSTLDPAFQQILPAGTSTLDYNGPAWVAAFRAALYPCPTVTVEVGPSGGGDYAGTPALDCPAAETTRRDLGDPPGVPKFLDPVTMSTGNWSHRTTRTEPSTSAYGLGVQRWYNSLGAFHDFDPEVLQLGTGWTTTLDTSLKSRSDLTLEYRNEDGQVIDLPYVHPSAPTQANPPDVWQAPEGTSGEVRLNTSPSPGGSNRYVLQKTDGERWEFDANGRLAIKCQGVADWATRPDWSATSGWVPVNGTTVNDWCGSAGNNQYVTYDWSQIGAATNPRVTVTSSTGASETFKLDAANGKLIQIVSHDDPTGSSADRVVDLHYNAGGLLDWTSFPHFSSEAGSVTAAPSYGFETYDYDTGGLLASVKVKPGVYVASPSGHDEPTDTGAVTEVANTYDLTTGRVVAQQTSSFDSATFDWQDPTGTVTVTNAGSGDVTTFKYDHAGHATQMVDPNAKTATPRFDQGTDHPMNVATVGQTQFTDRTGATDGTAYDSYGRPVQHATPDPTTGYVPPLAVDAGTDGCTRDAATGLFPDPTSGACNTTGKHFALETYDYDTSGRVIRHTDAAGVKTRYDYDPGVLVPKKVTVGEGSTDPAAPEVVTSYTIANNQVAAQTQAGVTTCFHYNTTVQLDFSTPAVSGACPSSPQATSTTYTYSALGAVVTTTGPVGSGTATASSGTAYFGTGQVRQQATPDPASGFVPPLASVTSEACRRSADGTFPDPTSSACNTTGKHFTVKSFTYYPTGETRTATDELGKTTTTTIQFDVTNQLTCNGGVGNDPEGHGVKTPCKVVTTTLPDTNQSAPSTNDYYDQSGDLRLTVAAGGAATWRMYGPLGRLRKTVDPTGVVTQNSYDDDGRLVGTQAGTQTGTAGADATATTIYDKRGRTLATTTAKNDATAVTTLFAYDQDDRVIQQVMAAPDGTLPARNPDGTFTGPRQVNDAVTTNASTTITSAAASFGAADVGVKIAGTTIPAGATITAINSPTSAQLSAPATATASNVTVTVNDVAWTLRATAYAATGAAKTTSLFRPDVAAGVNATTTTSYDTAGRPTCVDTLQVDATGTITHLYQATDYDPTTGHATTTRAPIAAVTGCADSPTDTTKWAITATSYNTDGSLNWTQNPVQYQTVHVTGFAGDPTNYRTATTYDRLGRPTDSQSPDPSNPGTATVTSHTCYTPRGETAAQIDAAGGVTAYAYYDQPGVVAAVIDPTGMNTNPTDPCASAPKTGADTNRGKVGYQYDGRGNRTARSVYQDDLTGQVTESWFYDLANRPTGYQSAASGGVNTTTGYTITNGRLTAKTSTSGSTSDASLRQTVDTYAPSGTVTDTTSLICGASAACAGVPNDANHRTVIDIAYDPLGRRATITDNSPGRTAIGYTYGYNTAGNITTMALTNGTTTKWTAAVAWDLTGKAVRQTYPSGAQFRYRYDPAQNLADVDVWTSPVWTNLTAYTNNANRQRTSETLVAGTTGTRTWTRDPATGTLDTYAQLMTGQTSIYTNVTYKATGRVATDCDAGTDQVCQSGTERNTTYSYDPAGQLTQAAVAHDSTAGHITNWAYSYGNRGQRTSETIAKNGAGTATTNYSYDQNTMELCTATTGSATPSCANPTGATTTYSYDRAGRRISAAASGATSYAYTYTPNGNAQASFSVTPAGSSTATYVQLTDPLDQQLCQDGSTNHTACIDASGNLINPANNNAWFYWDNTGATGPVTQELQATLGGIFGGTIIWYAYGGDRISQQNTSYVGQDYLGSASFSSNGPNSYSPYGESTANADPWFGYRSELQYLGQINLRARHYDPTTGTFQTRDPLDGIDGTTTVSNPYHYVDNDPLNKVDPTGLRTWDSTFAVPMPSSIDVPLPCLSTVFGICLGPITVPTPSTDNGMDKFETVARLAALEAVGQINTPTPATDAEAYNLAINEANLGAAVWVCREQEPNGPPALSWKYHQRVYCVAPARSVSSRGVAAFTLGHFVFCSKTENCEMGHPKPHNILEHEYWHVDQWEEFGDSFAALYAMEWANIRDSGGNPDSCDNRYERPAYEHNNGCP